MGEFKRFSLPPGDQRPSVRKRCVWKKLLVIAAVLALACYSCLPRLFTPGKSVARRNSTQIENLFLSVPDPASAIRASRAYSDHPHLAGSKEDYADAQVILELFQKEFGIDSPGNGAIFKAGSKESRESTINLSSLNHTSKPTSWIDIYYPFMNTPLDRSVEILDVNGIPLWQADLVEEVDPLDEDAYKYQDSVPTWHGLSRNGSAVGQLVYANYGSYEDYQSLKESGVDLTGKIVIVRYGGLFRGLKVKGAEELGAAAVLIYTDPRDDGFVTVENGYIPYPQGPARSPASVQRGSVQFLSMYPGDPTTEGYPSYENATRQEGRNIPKIPSLPISWKNAERLLEEIEDKEYLDEDGVSRLTGQASSRKIKLVNHVDDRVIPIYNTMAAIPGHIRNEVVMIGCHRDAWVLGAADPISGTVSLHEVIRGLGALLKTGWKPLRTILIASWDAEEYGLIGSTEYGEDFADWLSEHVVAYLNVDVSVSGSQWTALASPSLANLIRSAALEIPHPTDPYRTLWDARTDIGPFSRLSEGFTPDPAVMKSYNERLSQEVAPLGSGSDYSTFLQHLGIASTDQSFVVTPYDAPYHYHSIYDSHRWQEVYADPGFHRHVAVAKHLGLMTLRLADSIILPLNTTHYSLGLGGYLKKVEASLENQEVNFPVDLSPLRTAISKVHAASLALDSEKAVAEEHLKKLLDEIEKTRSTHSSWEELLDSRVDELASQRLRCNQPVLQPGVPIEDFIKAAKRVAKVNQKLAAFETGFISQEGIKEREWYKHLGVAPGKWLGYGASTFPALTESIVIDKNQTLAALEVDRLSSLLNNLAKNITP